MLGTSDAWPINPAYHIEDCWILSRDSQPNDEGQTSSIIFSEKQHAYERTNHRDGSHLFIKFSAQLSAGWGTTDAAMAPAPSAANSASQFFFHLANFHFQTSVS